MKLKFESHNNLNLNELKDQFEPNKNNKLSNKFEHELKSNKYILNEPNNEQTFNSLKLGSFTPYFQVFVLHNPPLG